MDANSHQNSNKGDERFSQFTPDVGDSGVDLTSVEESLSADKAEKGEESDNLDPSAMSHVKPAPKACLTSKVSALSDVTRASLYSSAQQVVDDLNSKRKQDTALLADFKKTLQEQVLNGCGRMEDHLYKGYEKQGQAIQQKLQELYACLDRIEKIETELHQFREALKILYQDMNQN